VKWFDYAAPETLGGAIELLASHPRGALLAGGTDLLVQLRSGRKQPDLVIDIKRIPEVNAVDLDAQAGLTLGSAVPCYRIYGDRAVARTYPALAEVAGLIGGTQIQGRASIGGNLCNGSPSADSVPLLIAMRATCRIAGPGGERELPVERFCTGPGLTVLGPGEMLVSLRIPPPPPNSGARYLRFIPRNEMDIAVAGAGVQVVLENGSFRSARIALAAVAPTPLLVEEAEAALAGSPVNELAVATAAAMARAAARPITDMRGTAEYRRHLCGVLTRRALESAIERAKESR
jgi:carbon-monoxide dehydrogenase medium subunit